MWRYLLILSLYPNLFHGNAYHHVNSIERENSRLILGQFYLSSNSSITTTENRNSSTVWSTSFTTTTTSRTIAQEMLWSRSLQCLGSHGSSSSSQLLAQQTIQNRITDFLPLSLLQLATTLQSTNIPLNQCLDDSILIAECGHSMRRSIEDEEIWHHLTLLTCPWNYAAAINYAFTLEYLGHYHAAKGVFTDCVNITGCFGCWLHGMLVSPLVLHSLEQGQNVYLNILADFYSFLLNTKKTILVSNLVEDIYLTLRELPVNIHYLGYNAGFILELLSRSITRSYSHLIMPFYTKKTAITTSSTRLYYGGQRVERKPLRLGVISEYVGNTSPGLCVDVWLPLLAKRWKERINLIFFDRYGLITVAADRIRSAAQEVIVLNDQHLSSAVEAIGRADIDVLLFMALGTEKFSFLLSHFRLAPVQVVIGVGHPVSSGVEVVDYIVLPAAMMRQPFVHEIAHSSSNGSSKGFPFPVNALRCAFEAYTCRGRKLQQSSLDHAIVVNQSLEQCMVPTGCLDYPIGMPTYREQVVLFDSMSYYLEEPKRFQYPEETLVTIRRIENYRPHSQDPYHSLSCDYINAKLIAIGIHPSNLTNPNNLEGLVAEELGCIISTTSSSSSAIQQSDNTTMTEEMMIITTPRTVHLFHSMQYVKKLHPLFDDILLSLLESDPFVKILLFDGFYQHVWKRIQRAYFHRQQGDDDGEDDDVNIPMEWQRRLIEIPRIDHVDYLLLTALSDAFLTPFPYGAGITSSEAISLCRPLVILPDAFATINFALSQVRRLGLQDIMATHSKDEYIQVAIWMAENNMSQLCHRIENGGYDDQYDQERKINLSYCLSHNSIHDLVCNRKTLLFGHEVVDESVEEWGSFLLRIAS